MDGDHVARPFVKTNDHIKLQLNIIGNVKRDEKLTISGEVVAIDPPSNIRGVRRWMRGDTRQICVDKVTEIVHLAMQMITGSGCTGRDSNQQRAVPHASDDAWSSSDHLLESLCNCRVGLENLAWTYAADRLIYLTLETLARDIDGFVQGRKVPPTEYCSP